LMEKGNGRLYSGIRFQETRGESHQCGNLLPPRQKDAQPIE
jgi:hypothetical protein